MGNYENHIWLRIFHENIGNICSYKLDNIVTIIILHFTNFFVWPYQSIENIPFRGHTKLEKRRSRRPWEKATVVLLDLIVECICCVCTPVCCVHKSSNLINLAVANVNIQGRIVGIEIKY